jgi:hypothetical protein
MCDSSSEEEQEKNPSGFFEETFSSGAWIGGVAAGAMLPPSVGWAGVAA